MKSSSPNWNQDVLVQMTPGDIKNLKYSVMLEDETWVMIAHWNGQQAYRRALEAHEIAFVNASIQQVSTLGGRVSPELSVHYSRRS